MQHGVHERRAPRLAHDLRAEDDVAELARRALRHRVTAVDRKGKRVGLLVDAQMVALERADLLRADELQAELAVVDALFVQHAANQLRRGVCVELGARPVRDLDLHHRRPYFRRCVPVSSACSLYASTMRWTSLCRTTSSCPKRTNAIPSIEPRMSWTWISP